MNRIVKVAKLHLNKPGMMFGVPTIIIGFVLVITVIIAFILQRAGMDPSSASYADGARGNMGMIWSLPGFLVYYGVQAVSTTFPFALALGTARKTYIAGTAIANLIQSAFITLVMAVLLIIELATNHWFFGVYALDNFGFGSGNIWVLIPTAFIGTFVSLSIGGVFGAVWVRWGSKGPTVLAIALALIIVLLLLLLVPYFSDIIAAITRPSLAVFGIAVAAAAVLGTWATMRRASVR